MTIGVQYKVELPLATATSLPSAWGLPPDNPNFFARKIVKKIPETLERQAQGIPTILVTVSGLGGIGKTELAKHFIHHPEKIDSSGILKLHNYTARIWMRGSSMEELISEYRDLAEYLHFSLDDKKSDALVINTIKAFLAAHPGWLMVIDNADDASIASLLPTQGGDIIITSRQSDWQGVKVEVDILEPDEAIQFYQSLSGTAQDTSEHEFFHIKGLMADLGYLPLAIAQAAAFIKNSQGRATAAVYRELLNKHKRFVLKQNYLPANTLEAGNRLTVMATWEISLNAIEKAHGDSQSELPFFAKELLITCSLLANLGIPYSLLLKWMEHVNNTAAPHVMVLENALHDLRQHSLIQFHSGHIYVHKLLQEVIYIQNPLAESRFGALTKAICLEAEKESRQKMEGVSRIVRFIPHSETLLQHYDSTIPNCERINATNLLNFLQDQYAQRGSYAQRRDILLRLLNQIQALSRLGIPINEISTNEVEVLSNLGDTFDTLGMYEEAINNLNQALKIKDSRYRSDDAETAMILINLGNAYADSGQYEKAYKVLIRALEISKKLHDDLTTAAALTNLGNTLNDLGRYQEAFDHLARARDISLEKYSSEHIKTAIILTSLGGSLIGLERYDEAEKTLSHALRIKENHYGKVHAEVAITLMSLGVALNALKKFSSAFDILSRGLKTQKDYYGTVEHQQVARTQATLAQTYLGLNENEKAIDLINTVSRTVKIIIGNGQKHPLHDQVRELKTIAGLTTAPLKP